MKRRRIAQICALAAIAAGLSGCAAPIIAGITLSQISMVAGAISTAVTGKGLSDQALSLLTGKDCNLTEAILHRNRKLCEEPGSIATAGDFKGVFVAFGGPDSDALDRVARARAEELASASLQAGAQTPVAVEQASGLSLLIRIGVPHRGEPVGLARIGGEIVYLMPPVDGADQQAMVVGTPRVRPTNLASASAP
jgi:hypothetical protein